MGGHRRRHGGIRLKGNTHLNRARHDKADEFYTLRSTIAAELPHYKEHLRGRSVLCNCDDPARSMFWRYLSENFSEFGLKELICSHLVPGGRSYVLRMTRAGQVCLPEPLDGDGGYATPECLALLDGCDAVVTNPPFSKWLDFVGTVLSHDKDMIVLGNMNSVTHRDIFPLFIDGTLSYGPSVHSGGVRFRMPDDAPRDSPGIEIINGSPYIELTGIRWFTTFSLPEAHPPIPLTESYSPEAYPRYDTYDAIEVSRTAMIPKDYDGLMGVPISYLDRHCPDQFDIIGAAGAGNNLFTPSVGGRLLYKRIVIQRKRGN